MDDGSSLQRTTCGSVVIRLLRFYLSMLGSQGDTLSHYQLLHISSKLSPGNPICSSYPALEWAVNSSKPYSLSSVSKFHLQLASTCILHLIIPLDGTEENWFITHSDFYLISLCSSRFLGPLNFRPWINLSYAKGYFIIRLRSGFFFSRWSLKG